MDNLLLNMIPARGLEARLVGATTAVVGGAASASSGMSLALSSAATIPSVSTAAIATEEMFGSCQRSQGPRKSSSSLVSGPHVSKESSIAAATPAV